MKKINVAILGTGKIGKYHVREFHHFGANVVAILGSSEESSSINSRKLEKEFNIKVKPYYILEELLKNEDLEAVSICTPPEMHELQTRKCLEKNLHVLCEKPFVQTDNSNYQIAERLFNLAEKKEKILTVNTQLASIAKYFIPFLKTNELKKMSMYMEPGKDGVGMLEDSLPHTNSLLIKLIPQGEAEDIKILSKTNKFASLKFTYRNKEKACEVTYNLQFKADRPRKIMFSLNETLFSRKIDSDYRQILVGGGKRVIIEDPLRVSIHKFLGAINGVDNLLVNKEEILENISLAEEIVGKYMS
jgi:hypothetical protein